ncbi:hypothetical protein BDY19DRAFT_995893 [Irpex rosettiformis]|uniref:Uncharacterized protein n=1 Tax=Irpex rosettiformis TaxID=378272 RepID=A0ACB8TWC9_9APHY|nr:hypothetical protein BDY19DRAFT_995893 [Irpex rosettiformis]
MSRYRQEFKTLVNHEVYQFAESLNIVISRNCPECGRPRTIAIGKKIAELGKVYLNCPFCPKVSRIHDFALSQEVIDRIESARAIEVELWLATEGSSGYIASVAEAAGMPTATSSSTMSATGSSEPPPSQPRRRRRLGQRFTPIPCTPPPSGQKTQSTFRLPSFEETLFKSIGHAPSPLKRQASTSHASELGDPILSDSDIEIISPIAPTKKGSKENPILLSAFKESASTSAKRQSSANTKTTAKQEAKDFASASYSRFARLGLEGRNMISAEEYVPRVFSIEDFQTICAALNITASDRFEVYYPTLCGWGGEINHAVPIANYPEEYDTIILRRSGVKNCVGFHSAVGRAFKD